LSEEIESEMTDQMSKHEGTSFYDGHGDLPVQVNGVDFYILVKENHIHQLMKRILKEITTSIFRVGRYALLQVSKSQGYQLMYWYGIAMLAEFPQNVAFMCFTNNQTIGRVTDMIQAFLIKFNQVRSDTALHFLQSMNLLVVGDDKNSVRVGRVTLPGALNSLVSKSCRCESRDCKSAKLWSIRDKIWYWACKQFAMTTSVTQPVSSRYSHLMIFNLNQTTFRWVPLPQEKTMAQLPRIEHKQAELPSQQELRSKQSTESPLLMRSVRRRLWVNGRNIWMDDGALSKSPRGLNFIARLARQASKLF
jgi:hypothetical protein